jgi:hypothetical protein
MSNNYMTSITFDTLKYTKRLEAAGFTREQAEAQTEVIADALRESGGDYAPKSDISQFKSEMKVDFQSLENRIHKEIAPIKTNIAVLMWGQGLIILTVVIPALKGMLGL